MGCGSSNDKPEWQVMDTAWKGTPKKMDALLTKFKVSACLTSFPF